MFPDLLPFALLYTFCSQSVFTYYKYSPSAVCLCGQTLCESNSSRCQHMCHTGRVPSLFISYLPTGFTLKGEIGYSRELMLLCIKKKLSSAYQSADSRRHARYCNDVSQCRETWCLRSRGHEVRKVYLLSVLRGREEHPFGSWTEEMGSTFVSLVSNVFHECL